MMIVSTGISVLHAGEYHVSKDRDNLVKFISDALIEEFEGVTDKIDGYLFWEGEDLTAKSDLYFEVDLNTLDTGIGLRNRHMRENYLETETYPFTHFKGKIVQVDTVSNDKFNVRAEGIMFIHGVEQKKSVEAVLIKNNDVIQVQAAFEVKLSDYKIDIPSIMFYKIDEVMRLEMDFFIKQVNK